MEVPPSHITEHIIVRKTNPHADFPAKENVNDVEWNITLVSRTDNRAEDETGEINYFNTGLHIKPPKGYFLELIASKALYRTGYMLTGPVIIEPDNKGELIVPLYKFRDSEDIELPFVAVSLLTRPAIYAHVSHTAVQATHQQNKSYSDSKPIAYKSSTRSHMF